VEPVFLFGTLDRIRGLYRSDSAAASAMLEDLIAYLRAVLPHLRESSSTVAQEAQLVQAWLDIVARSLPGLAVEIELDAAAAAARLPALVLLPLVQHAVGAAGQRPLQLRLAASALPSPGAARLRLELSADGAAFAGTVAGQPLLEQIAERLDALYGKDAQLSIDSGSARIELPLKLAETHPEVLP
jgi:LytS/YehU family sensor histidine kinase